MKHIEIFILDIVDSLGLHPIVGASISLISASFGMLLGSTEFITEGIAQGVKDIFQLIAWICTITVSTLTIIGLVRKELKELKEKKREKTKNNSKKIS